MLRLTLSCNRISWIALFWLCSGLLFASEDLVLNEEASPGNLAASFVYISDRTVASRKQALALPPDRWQKLEHDIFNEGFVGSGFWLKATIRSDVSLEQGNWLLVLNNVLMEELSVYWQHDSEGLLLELVDFEAGQFAKLPLQGRHWLVPLTIQPGQSYTLLVHMKSFVVSQMPASILPVERYLEHELLVGSLLNMAVAALLVIAVVGLLLALVYRDIGLFYHSVFVLGVAILHASLQGLIFHWLWPHWPWLHKNIAFLAIVVALWAGVMFTREQMSSPESHPMFPKLLYFFAWLQPAVALTSLLLPLHLRWQVNVLYLLSSVVTALVMGFVNSLRGQRVAIYYTAAMTIFFIGTFLLALNKLGFIPVNVYTDNLQLVGSLVGSVIFLLSVNERVNQKRLAKRAVKQQALDYERVAHETQVQLLRIERQTSEGLEQQVHARTAELERALQELKTAHSDLQLAKAAEEKAHLEKTRFLAAASHDIRQPLHALTLLVEDLLLSTPAQTAETVRTGLRVREAVDSLSALFDALFDLSKLDNKLVRPELELIDLAQLVSDYGERIQPLCQHANTVLQVDIPEKAVMVMSDRLMLERILTILIDNAVNHSGSNRIGLVVSVSPSQLRLSVIDHGIGIAENDQVHIFEEFYQVDNEQRNRSRGMGLGLALCRRLVGLIGCEITLHSARGQGARFDILMSRSPKDTATESSGRKAEGAQPTLCLQDKLVLVVDDDVLAREASAQLLQRWGMSVLPAADGTEALAVLGEARAPEFALLDYRLPGSNGLELAKAIRARLGSKFPIIILTGDLRLSISEPDIRVLSKPIRPMRLRAAIQAILQA
ncbi:MAG: hypothetical protein CME36_16535 [unclassified Hahellaceae]|nr:hypothetical protein [Hahellaceae bacterium]|tara:strand:- start:183558 stop:186059 length:2502 start_codon:yes stop_codon:yes gene_type:complete